MHITRRTAVASLIGAIMVSRSNTFAAASPAQRIGVIGAGSLGGTVGRLWVQAGHEVMFSTRHPEELAPLVRQAGPRASAGTAEEAARFGSILLFAVPYDALEALGRDLHDLMRGKVVLDACNPSAAHYEALARQTGSQSVAEISSKFLPDVRLVRAFSAVDATAVEASSKRRSEPLRSEPLGVPIASDDTGALQIAARLVRDVGCEPVITGNLASAASFQRSGPGFRANTDAVRLRQLLGLPAATR
jgi:8-hydroxy-5-deazaflavin:NADPH oxidoreductase